ncbi:hypothetical protein FRB95_014173 [Tulasnella sp. JGI-2019a]|nr:hypothetical protein FRB93_001854 [Tulasnella sp. JGI-2019a]KAG9033851.1 hypothetical protein FRB95_014173 [Tulasnella sp. JGI-2019a]
MMTTTADALVLELPPSQLGADQLTRLTMKSPQWPSYPYLGILPGVESTSVIPGLFYFRACNADAQANTDIKDTTPLGAVFVWSVLKDDLRVYWPASKSYLEPRIFTTNGTYYMGQAAKNQLWLLSDDWTDNRDSLEVVKLVLDRF